MGMGAWAALVLVSLAAGALQGATGFGYALLVIAFYLEILDSIAAVQLTIVLSLAISLFLVPGIRRGIAVRLLGRLLAGALLGLPIGMSLYRTADLPLMKFAVALLILGMAARLLFARAPVGEGLEIEDIRLRPVVDVAVGAVGGVLATSLGMPGPPILLYLTAIGAHRDVIRATTLAYLILAYVAALAIQGAVVGIAPEVWTQSAVLLPVAVAGAFIGLRIARHLGQAMFRRLVLWALVVAALYSLREVILG